MERLIRAWYPPLLEDIEKVRPLLENEILIDEEMAGQLEAMFVEWWPGEVQPVA